MGFCFESLLKLGPCPSKLFPRPCWLPFRFIVCAQPSHTGECRAATVGLIHNTYHLNHHTHGTVFVFADQTWLLHVALTGNECSLCLARATDLLSCMQHDACSMMRVWCALPAAANFNGEI